jgi:hypothetical protein
VAHQVINLLVNLFLIIVLIISSWSRLRLDRIYVESGTGAFFLLLRCRKPFWKKEEETQHQDQPQEA